MTDRGVAPVVGKALEAGMVLVYVGVVAAALYGGVVPDYRTAAADEVGQRTLSAAATEVEAAVPAVGRNVSATVPLALPDRIRGDAYTLSGGGSTLVLDHPHPGVGGRTALVLPDRVTAVTGTVHSDERGRVVVRETRSGIVVELRTP
jgi:hypothetical protein